MPVSLNQNDGRTADLVFRCEQGVQRNWQFVVSPKRMAQLQMSMRPGKPSGSTISE